MFSLWRAAGNEYLVAERAETGPLTPELVREACAGDSDGVLEVLRAGPGLVEIVIWNADGSIAEMSGNGTRIAASWLLERHSGPSVTVVVGPLTVEARVHQAA